MYKIENYKSVWAKLGKMASGSYSFDIAVLVSSDEPIIDIPLTFTYKGIKIYDAYPVPSKHFYKAGKYTYVLEVFNISTIQ